MPRLVVRKALALLAATLVFGLLLPGLSGAIPPGGPDPQAHGAHVQIDRATVRAGGRIHVEGWNWKAKGSRLYDSPVVTVKLDDLDILAVLKIQHKKFSGWVPIPKHISLGKHWLRFLASEPPTSIRSGNLTVLRAR
jgi:hypothetical protein